MIHAAWIAPPLAHAGTGLASVAVAEALRRRGHRIDLLVADERLRLHPGSTPAQAALALRTLVERTVREWSEAWRRERPQVVHVELPGNLGRAAAQAARGLGIPVSSGWHHLPQYAPAGKAQEVRRLALDFHRACVATVVENPADAVELGREGIPGVVCIGRGVDTDRFHPRHRDPALRAAWGAGADDPVLLWFGRVIPQKAPPLFAAACGAARAVQPAVRAVVVGDGPEMPRLRTALPWLTHAGLLRGDDLARAVASADLLVFPSQTENFGMAVTEAMAAGVPVLAYRLAAAGMHVADGVAGRLAAPGDVAGFVEAAVHLVRDVPTLRRMGAAARTAAEPLTWDAVAGDWERLFAGLSPGTPSGSR